MLLIEKDDIDSDIKIEQRDIFSYDTIKTGKIKVNYSIHR